MTIKWAVHVGLPFNSPSLPLLVPAGTTAGTAAFSPCVRRSRIRQLLIQTLTGVTFTPEFCTFNVVNIEQLNIRNNCWRALLSGTAASSHRLSVSERSVQRHASFPLYPILQQLAVIFYLIHYAACSGSELHLVGCRRALVPELIAVIDFRSACRIPFHLFNASLLFSYLILIRMSQSTGSHWGVENLI